MSAFAQLTNENIIELYYDERDIGNYTGCTYPLGTHLANYLWFDLKAINYEYQSLAKLNLTDSFAIDDNMFIDVLNRILTKIDSFCPYLHFHSQILIKAMLNAWKNKSIIAPIEILSLPKPILCLMLIYSNLFFQVIIYLKIKKFMMMKIIMIWLMEL